MVNTQYDIRIATMADTEILATLGSKTFYQTFAQYNTVEDMDIYLQKTFTVAKLRIELQDPSCTFVIAFDKTTPIGYAKLRIGEVPEEIQTKSAIEIERIYALQDYLGKNVGKALMQACLNLAHHKNYSAIWLGVWEHNAKAIKFYERWGFEKFGAHNFLLGKDLQTDLLMKLSLQQAGDRS